VKTFDEEEFPGLALNEFICLQAAAKAGLRIPTVEVSDDGRWLSVERFDLVHAGADSRYIAFEDMCSLSGRTSVAKYHGSYEMIAESIRDFSSDFRADAEQFFTMLVLSCVMRNGDAHRKNFGVLYEGRGDARLAPAFDIICTDVYPQIESRMALSLDGSEAWPDAKRLMRFGVRHCQLDSGSVREIIAKVSEAAIESLAFLNDKRMPRTAGRLMRLSVESGVASMQAAQLRRNSAPAEQPCSTLAETAAEFTSQLEQEPLKREGAEVGPPAS
jgi:serine/threonine-protein kinase HipA